MEGAEQRVRRGWIPKRWQSHQKLLEDCTKGKDIEGFQPVFVWLDVSTENNCRAKNRHCEGQKGVAQTESTIGLGALKVDTN